ncbi:acetyl-CoA carboxylase carboxyltransferase subunit alpha [Rhizohabitans arisaemae]|uniref:acetyl-CoA carboxylase carboxyltransferase subunit alpha n=1 Tax=Rhizohabitans arisaemae TaxID=2720610 RepID=UPI0024B19B59|nr:acetyl-CoA carboxylase carboxyltransferase subunit alpha [Rhizohabitans arisaemae]
MTVQTEPAPEWLRCAGCGGTVYGKRYRRDLNVCPDCGLHGRLTAPERIERLLDEGAVPLTGGAAVAEDPLAFLDRRPYPESLAAARRATGLEDAVVGVRGTVHGHPVVAAVMDFRFFGGSMGSLAGERLTEAMETSLRERIPLLLVTASGGARMQEGALALLQMAKTSQAMGRLDEAGILTISLITDPTYGGVAASFATLSDVILAEPGARLGFAGRRVIEQTIRQRLPEGFQTAEFLAARGLVDGVVSRGALRGTLSRLLAATVPATPPERPYTLIRTGDELPPRDAWETVRLARHVDRPTTLDYIGYLLEGFQELHGDRLAADCPAIVGGLGRLGGVPVMLIGHEKGHRTADRAKRNFGMATPAGYRKSARLMRLAAKLGVPVVTLIDTPGAYPGIEAEENGQAVAIAESIRLMSALPVPIVSVITGEGGSGGALALGVADRVLALSGAVYSVISPEGCAAILWKDAAAAPQAAGALRLTTRDLLALGVIDAVVPEPPGGAHEDPGGTAELLRDALIGILGELTPLRGTELVEARRDRFRRYGLAPA